MIIDAQNLALGRIASVAAKQALLGEDVKVINCSRAVITGNRKAILKHYLRRLELGQPRQGPFVQRRSDFFVKRTIRGMLPKKKQRGRSALSKIRCFTDAPESVQEKDETFKMPTAKKAGRRLMTVGELCMHLGTRR